MDEEELTRRINILDARDKILRQQMPKQTELNQARRYVGSCSDMCPERERYFRLRSRISVFEHDDKNQPNECYMVKEYRRAGADQEEPLPHDLRTPRALETTMDHLIYNIMDDPRSQTPEMAMGWYDFLWDRLRAIRKDITQQNICDHTSIALVERCTRFHIHCCYSMNRVKDFDVNMNKKNLNDCLQMLRHLYNDLKLKGITCENELEFQRYDILLHLPEDPLSTTVLMKTSEYRSTLEMKVIADIFHAFTLSNYHKFFRLMEQADYMTSCILSLYVNAVRLTAIKITMAACTSKTTVSYPADLVMEALRFDGLNDIKLFAATLEIELTVKDFKTYLLFNKDTLAAIRQVKANSFPPVKSFRLVESKMDGSKIGQLIYYAPLSSKDSQQDSLYTNQLEDAVEIPHPTLKHLPLQSSDFWDKEITHPTMKNIPCQNPDLWVGEVPHPTIKNLPSQSSDLWADELLNPTPKNLPSQSSDLWADEILDSTVKNLSSQSSDLWAENLSSIETKNEMIEDEKELSNSPEKHELMVECESQESDESMDESIDEIDEELVAAKRRKLEEISMMPAGYFRTSKIQRRNVVAEQPPKPAEQVIRRTTNTKEKLINLFRDSIEDEKKANQSLSQLMKLFFNS